MRKLTKRYKNVLLYRSRRKFKFRRKMKNRARSFFVVDLWDGEIETTAICQTAPTIPPKNINFDANLNETLDFLLLVRETLGKKRPPSRRRQTWIKRRKNKRPTIRSYYDFGGIENLSVAPALVIAASYDRAKRLVGAVPPAVNYRQWSQSSLQTFYEIGFFDLIGQKQNEKLIEEYDRKARSDIKILKAISGFNANGLEQCSVEISKLLLFLTANNVVSEFYIPEINTAISEAMINVARHAYPEEFVMRSRYDTIGQWWLTARADRSNSTMTIVIYDQGASIPGTLPSRNWFKEVVTEIVKTLIPTFTHSEDYRALDHEYIKYSMKPGRSQTRNPERGLGLPQMQELIDRCADGYISIVSRGGYYRYNKGGVVNIKPLSIEIEGTLVEWHLSI